MNINNQIEALSHYIESSEKILLICHVNPDGDAIGSMLAMYYYLQSKGKQVDMIAPNYLQEFLKWMDGSELINVFLQKRKKSYKLIESADLIIMLDFSQSDRLGDIEKSVLNSKAKKVIIDHHINPGSFSDFIISDSSRCATAELVYDIVNGLEGAPFNNYAYNEAIYVGIITDTGSFEFGSYNGHTLCIVAELLDAGIDKEKIRFLVFNNFTADRMRLMGFALDQRMVILDEYDTAFIYLSKEDLLKYNHVKGDTEGFVNLPLQIKSIQFAVLLLERESLIKLSFRSKGDFAVNEFASRFYGGGGHKNAAGGEFQGSLNDAIDSFNRYLTQYNPKSTDVFLK